MRMMAVSRRRRRGGAVFDSTAARLAAAGESGGGGGGGGADAGGASVAVGAAITLTIFGSGSAVLAAFLPSVHPWVSIIVARIGTDVPRGACAA